MVEQLITLSSEDNTRIYLQGDLGENIRKKDNSNFSSSANGKSCCGKLCSLLPSMFPNKRLERNTL